MPALLLLVLLLLAGATAWATLGTAPAPQPQNTAPEQATDGPSQPRPQLQGRQAKSSTDQQVQRAAKADSGAQTPAAAKPLSALARSLGWPEAEAQQASSWHKEAVDKQEAMLAELSDGGGRAVAAEFNQAMRKRREALCQQLGVAKANAFLARQPLYQIDLGSGTWIRVDAEGNPLPFPSEDARTRLQDFRPVR